jgi:adhesin transport system membrane fusion protein
VPFALIFLLVESKVNPRTSPFLRPGLPTKVSLTAYDFAICVGLEAQVGHISADTFIEENGDP